jgi:hypothetical protein
MVVSGIFLVIENADAILYSLPPDKIKFNK